MPARKMTSQKILTICIGIMFIANILLTAHIVSGLGKLKSSQRESLPCQAVPIRFVIDEPECADKLLRSMNVSNVRILPHNGTYVQRTE